MSKVKSKSKVSVVVPAYNRAKVLKYSVESVLEQTYQNFEIVVVDDGSTDNTEEVIKSFNDGRIRYIKHEKNEGGARARNTGIKAARSNYIAFQDSDDEWLPEKLEKQVKVLESLCPEVGVVYTDMWKIRGDKREYFYSPRIMPSDEIIYERALDYRVRNIGIATALIRKECFDKVGMFNDKLPRYIDLELFIRLSKYFYFYHIKEPLLNYYNTDKSISSNVNDLVTARKFILEQYFDDIKQNKKVLANHYFGIGISLCSSGDFKTGRDYLIKAIKVNPLHIQSLLAVPLTFCGRRVYEKTEKICKTMGKKTWCCDRVKGTN